MKERVKFFTHISGQGSTVADTELEGIINEWLASTEGKIASITQSESNRDSRGQHITVCVWYRPDEAGSS
ncbi:MAG: hypothetical protein H8E44_14420 [Planctomycetes bacterium]|nr:hypothetical protein [Planctomycetota bacterium]MBL7041163.1 hypothetical protein [Pirellulaceae bacterium]